MIDFLLESLVILSDLVFVVFLCSLNFNRRNNSKKEIAFLAITSLCIVFAVGYLNNILFNRLVLFLVYLITSVVVVFSFFEEKLIIIAGLSTLYISFINVLEFLFLMFAEYVFCVDGFIYETLVGIGVERGSIVLISRMCAFLFCVYIKKKEVKINLGIKFSCVILGLGIFSFLCMQHLLRVFVDEYNRNTQQMVFLAFGFMISFFTTVILVMRERQRIVEGMIEKEMFETRLMLSEERNASTLKSYREIAKMSHDYKNHFQVISILLKNKDENSVADYISKIIEDSPKEITKFSGISAIDAVLSSKCDIARNNNINFNCRVDSTIPLEINKTDVCTILLNLLDNAVEACMMIDEEEKRFIKVTASNNNAMFFIKVENPYNTLRTENDYCYNREKKQNNRRGYGLKIVEGIAEKYNGCLTITKDNNIFTSIVLLNS